MEKDYERIRHLKCRVVAFYGPKGIKKYIKTNYVILLAILFSIIVVFFLSNIILSVEINHSNKKLKNMILDDLKDYGITKYHFKVSYQRKEKIKKKILFKRRKRISYMEIMNSGTKYIVNIEERKDKKESTNKTPRHIVASDDALIVDIDASQGEIVKKVNDYVKRGDIIVSGIIHNKEKETSKVHSRGKVIGELWYKVTVVLPNTYVDEIVLNRKHKIISLKAFNKYLNIRKYKTSIIIKERVLYKNKILPLSINYVEEEKVKRIRKKYTDQKVKETAFKIATNKLKEQVGKDIIILEKQTLKKLEKDSKIEVDIFLKIQKDITEFIDIENVSLKAGDGDAKSNN